MAYKADKTPDQIAAENLAKARKATEERNNERVNRLNAIADNNDNDPDSDMVDVGGNIVLQEAENKLPSDAERAQAEEVARLEAARALQEEGVDQTADDPELEKVAKDKDEGREEDPNIRVADGVTTYRTVVNGKEKWLTLDQLIATSQKVEAADEYLEQAKAKVPKEPEVVVEPEPKEDAHDWAATLNAAIMGDAEAIKQVASALKARPSEMTPDVVRQIDDRWTFRNAVTWFEENYQDVLGDPRLKKLVYEEDSTLAKANPKMPYKERLQQAGNAVRSAVDSWQKTPPKLEVKPSNAKLEAKRQLPVVPTAAARQKAATEEEQEESAEETIAAMAKARGQGRAFVHRSTTR